MKLTFKGDGDHTVCTAFGMDFPVGEAVEVHGEHPAASLADNPMFDAADSTPDAPRRGRPPKAQA